MCVYMYVFKSNSKFLERQGRMNKQKTTPPLSNIVQNKGHSKLEASPCQGCTLRILKQLAAKG